MTTATFDYIKGTGTYTTYYNLTLKDGSALNFPEAPVSVLRGTGRFEGAKGEGRRHHDRRTFNSAYGRRGTL